MRKTETGKKTQSEAQTIGRALAIIDLFAPDHLIWTMEEICEALRCSTPTGYRYTRELVAAGLLRKQANGFALGPRIVVLDYLMQQTDALLRVAIPVMQEFAGTSGCDPVLTSAYGMQILDVYRIQNAASPVLTFGRGRPRPLFFGASPKIILGMLPLPWLRKLYEKDSAAVALAGMGDSWAVFRSRIAAIRRRGFYVSRGELEPDIAAVSAPIPATVEQDPSAIALVTTIGRLEELGEDFLARQVSTMAERIDAALRGKTE